MPPSFSKRVKVPASSRRLPLYRAVLQATKQPGKSGRAAQIERALKKASKPHKRAVEISTQHFQKRKGAYTSALANVDKTAYVLPGMAKKVLNPVFKRF